MSKLPRVSIIIPMYNSEKYLVDCLESAMAQNYPNIEIIVVDDGSTDGCRDIALKFKRVKLITQKRGGACRARNYGLRESSGELVKFLDSDDMLTPDIIARQVDHNAQINSDTISYSDIVFFNDGTEDKRFNAVVLSSTRSQELELLDKNIQTPCALYPREALLAVNGFDERLLKAQEYNLNLRLSLKGYKFSRLAVAGTHVRLHDSPHRISNQGKSQMMIENANLRARLYVDMFRDKYHGHIPSEIQKFFVRTAVKTALTGIQQADARSINQFLSHIKYIHPGQPELLSGIASETLNFGTQKLQSLSRRINQFFKKDK